MKKLVYIFFIAVLSANLAECVHVNKKMDENVLSDVSIYMYSERPPLSGYIKTWVRLTVRADDGKYYDLFIPYLREDTYFPPVGSICDIYYHYDDVDGLVGLKTEHLDHARVVDKII